VSDAGPRWGAPSEDYGFGAEDATTRRLLRSRPPGPALAWVASALGGTAVTSVRALRGGRSSAIHALTVRGPGEARRRVVLRRWVRADLLAEEPELGERELHALRAVAAVPLPTPEVLAHDLTGERAGTPALLMSRLQGRVVLRPDDLDRWVDGLVGVLLTLHAAPPPPAGTLPPYAPYRQERDQAPPWSRLPGVWRRALAIASGPPPAGPEVLVHRDFHPGNVLWRRGRVSGVVDWVAASVGRPSVDVAHARANLAALGTPVVDRFTARWEQRSGATFDPWADVVTITGFLDDISAGPPTPTARCMEDLLAASVAALG
jgi:aminoglycoside phosphotransferase (APT) family kinase protein